MQSRAPTLTDKQLVVKAVLDDLATKNVKATLLQERCTGMRGESIRCPVAKYVFKKSAVQVIVDPPIAHFINLDFICKIPDFCQ